MTDTKGIHAQRGRLIPIAAGALFACVATWSCGEVPEPAPGKMEASSDEAAWQDLGEMPVALWEPGTVVLDNKFYLFGGYIVGNKSVTQASVYDPATNTWQQLADLPSSLTHFNAVLDGRSVWIAGGFKDGYPGKAIDEVWRYDVDENKYVAGPPLPEPRAGGGLALVGRHLHYIGGLMSDRDTDSPAHWMLDLEAAQGGSGEWKNAAPMPAARNQFSAITFEGRIWAIGGQFHHDSGQHDQARTDIYDPATDSWSSGPELPAGHSHAEGSSFLHDGRIFVIGGMTGGPDNRGIEASVRVLSPGGGWDELAHLPLAVSSPAAAIIGGRLIVMGGSPDGKDPQPKMWSRAAP